MNLEFPAESDGFRQEVVSFLEREWVSQSKTGLHKDLGFVREFRARATEEGYLYRGVPRRYGGSEQPADPIRAHLIRECFQKVRAPLEFPGNGVSMLAPTLLECGTEAQREQFIPKTLTGEYRWAQGYSEPGAGSDLASLTTRGVLQGDNWVINGQKIWTTLAFQCTHMFALVRTEQEAGKHTGISYLLLEMDQPGITVKKIHQISGQSEFCEVFMEDARTPANWIVGKRGEGWTVSKSTLKHERNSIGGERTLHLFESLLRLARNTTIDGQLAIDNPVLRDRIFAIEGFVRAQVCSGYFQLTKAINDEGAGLHPLMNKLGATATGLEIAQIASEIINDRGLYMPSNEGSGRRNPEQWLNQIFGSLAMSIAGGTSNIQRNIIAERGLGLPREPSREES